MPDDHPPPPEPSQIRGYLPVPAQMETKGDVTQNWKFFKHQWANYEVATGLKTNPMEVRVATLLSVLGKDAYKVFMDLAMPDDDRKNCDKVIEALESHFEPQRNVIHERSIFNSTIQDSTMSVDDYIQKLRHLAKTCDYGLLTDEMIRDRLVLGCKDANARARMLRDNKLTLQKAIDMCRANELVNKQLQHMGPDEVNYAQKFKARGSKPKHTQAPAGKSQSFKANPKQSGAKHSDKSAQYTKKCKYCGKMHKFGKKSCPAYGTTCHKCGKLNHYASECMSSTHEVKALGHDTDSSEDSLFHIINSVDTTGKQWFVTVDINKQPLNCQIDTGATCNVMSLNDYNTMTNPPELVKSDSKLKLYNNDVLKPVGKIFVESVYKGKMQELCFEVVELTKHKPLLSALTCKQLNIIQVDSVNTVNNTPMQDDIIRQYSDCFEGLGLLPGTYHLYIDDNVKPVQHQPRRIPVALKPAVDKKILELEQRGVIKRVTEPTDWISSMVVVQKPGKIRICLDPRDLNLALKRSHYQMPTLEEILPKLAKAKVFSILDAKDGFWQIKLDDESSYLTTFWTPQGRYRWLRMPFGISTATEEFQRRLHEVLHDIRGADVIHDDILVYGCGDTMEDAMKDHDVNLQAVLERAREVNLKLNKKKLRLRVDSVTYMGHMLTSDGLKPDPSKVEAVQNMPKPSNVQEIQRFLGFINYLSKFLPSLSEVCEPLRRLTIKDTVWSWESQQENAYNSIKQMITHAPVLRYYDVTKPVTIQCDASDVGLGAALLQEGAPVAFASRSLSDTERRYAVIEKECLAIVFACKRFNQYVYGRQNVKVDTDHKPLETIAKKSLLAAPKRLQGMLLQLQKYDLQINYKRGKDQLIADMLSRASLPLKHDDPTNDNVVNVINESNISHKTVDIIREATQCDNVSHMLANTIQNGWPAQKADVPPELRPYWTCRDELAVQNTLIYRGNRLIVPAAVRPKMMKRIHSSHLGIEACLRRAREHIYWPRMNSEVKDAISQCTVCQEVQAKQPKETLVSHTIPTLPWSKVGIDLFSIKENNYLVLVDYMSDYIEVEELTDTTAETVIKYCQQQFSRHGIPSTVMSDNGPQFTSILFHDFANDWEFDHITSSPHHSQSNGKAESAVKIVKHIITKASKDGENYLKALLDWRNTSTSGMSTSPVQRLMSRRTRTTIPTKANLLEPRTVQITWEEKQRLHRKAKSYYDLHAKTLPKLVKGQPVMVQPTKHKAPWSRGVCVEELSPRSYNVEVDGKLYRRTRKHLRATKGTYQKSVQQPDVIVPDDITPDIVSGVPKTVTEPVSEPTGVPEVTASRRSKRDVKPPTRFQDYVMDA